MTSNLVVAGSNPAGGTMWGVRLPKAIDDADALNEARQSRGSSWCLALSRLRTSAFVSLA
jgi:hypothetical protein